MLPPAGVAIILLEHALPRRRQRVADESGGEQSIALVLFQRRQIRAGLVEGALAPSADYPLDARLAAVARLANRRRSGRGGELQQAAAVLQQRGVAALDLRGAFRAVERQGFSARGSLQLGAAAVHSSRAQRRGHVAALHRRRRGRALRVAVRGVRHSHVARKVLGVAVVVPSLGLLPRQVHRRAVHREPGHGIGRRGAQEVRHGLAKVPPRDVAPDGRGQRRDAGRPIGRAAPGAAVAIRAEVREGQGAGDCWRLRRLGRGIAEVDRVRGVAELGAGLAPVRAAARRLVALAGQGLRAAEARARRRRAAAGRRQLRRRLLPNIIVVDVAVVAAAGEVGEELAAQVPVVLEDLVQPVPARPELWAVRHHEVVYPSGQFRGVADVRYPNLLRRLRAYEVAVLVELPRAVARSAEFLEQVLVAALVIIETGARPRVVLDVPEVGPLELGPRLPLVIQPLLRAKAAAVRVPGHRPRLVVGLVPQIDQVRPLDLGHGAPLHRVPLEGTLLLAVAGQSHAHAARQPREAAQVVDVLGAVPLATELPHIAAQLLVSAQFGIAPAASANIFISEARILLLRRPRHARSAIAARPFVTERCYTDA